MKTAIELGAMLRAKRENLGLGITQLAAKCNVTEQTIRNIESGATGVPTLVLVLDALGVKLGDM